MRAMLSPKNMVFTRPELPRDRKADQIRDEDVGAELLQLDRRLERRHEADEEVDHENDGDAVGSRAFHEPRYIAPVDGAGRADRARPGERDVTDEVEPVVIGDDPEGL